MNSGARPIVDARSELHGRAPNAPVVLHIVDTMHAGGTEMVLAQLIERTQPQWCHTVGCVRELGALSHRVRAAGAAVHLIKLGAARKEAWAGGLADHRSAVARIGIEAVTPETFGVLKLNWQRLRDARRREGSYLLRSNVTGGDPAQLWAFYLQLVEGTGVQGAEEKGDLGICPIYHQTDGADRGAHLCALLAYCLQVTLKQRLRSLAPGLTPRSVLDKMAVIQMVDVHLPTTDGRTVVLSRYTEPEADQASPLERLKLALPTSRLPG